MTSTFPSRDICVLARSGATVPYIAMASPEKVKLAEASVVCEKLLDFSEVLDVTDQCSHWRVPSKKSEFELVCHAELEGKYDIAELPSS